MKIPRFTWKRRHNIAVIHVSYSPRVWQTRNVGDLVLGYSATGRLARVILLDPKRMLPDDAEVADAIGCVIVELLRAGAVRQAELDVLRSAMDRAEAPLEPTT
jgi:hypothetical protein